MSKQFCTPIVYITNLFGLCILLFSPLPVTITKDTSTKFVARNEPKQGVPWTEMMSNRSLRLPLLVGSTVFNYHRGPERVPDYRTDHRIDHQQLEVCLLNDSVCVYNKVYCITLPGASWKGAQSGEAILCIKFNGPCVKFGLKHSRLFYPDLLHWNNGLQEFSSSMLIHRYWPIILQVVVAIMRPVEPFAIWIKIFDSR